MQLSYLWWIGVLILAGCVSQPAPAPTKSTAALTPQERCNAGFQLLQSPYATAATKAASYEKMHSLGCMSAGGPTSSPSPSPSATERAQRAELAANMKELCATGLDMIADPNTSAEDRTKMAASYKAACIKP